MTPEEQRTLRKKLGNALAILIIVTTLLYIYDHRDEIENPKKTCYLNGKVTAVVNETDACPFEKDYIVEVEQMNLSR